MLQRTTARNRSGVILLIVITLLALFAAVGLAFVYYAGQEAAISRNQQEAEGMFKADVTAELLMSHFLGEWLYGTTNVYSVMRGHDLGTSLYGYNSAGLNTIPFNGLGRLHYPVINPQYPSDASKVQDNYFLINYMYFGDSFCRDPERMGVRGNAKDPKTAGAYVGGANVPWTYPDLNNVFLAAVGANGEVLLPSFDRPWTRANPVDPYWNKYLQLWPDSIYHPNFPPSEEGPGAPHVKNLDNSLGTRKPGGGRWMNDSYWIDLGFPVLTAPNGKKYKPMFAALIIDLDGKINLNIHGNIKGPGGTHVSNQGWGPWEVNAGRVFSNANPAPTEIAKLIQNRYGADGVPSGTPPVFNGGQPPSFFSAFDLDGNGTFVPLPTTNPAPPAASITAISAFPTFPAGFGSGSAAELAGHPAAWKYFAPGGDDRTPLADSNFEAILRLRGTGSPGLSGDPYRIMPQSFASSPRARWQVTPRSMDLAAAGSSPWNHFDSISSGTSFDYKRFLFYNDCSFWYWSGKNSPPPWVHYSPYRRWDDGSFVPTSRPYPYYIGGTYAKTDGLAFPLPPWPTAYAGTEFGADWRSTLSAMPKINLNRPLQDYPPQQADGRIALPDANYNKAVADRQQFAKDLYTYLVKLTGAMDPNTVPLTFAASDMGIDMLDKTNAYRTATDAARYLAQLAVNIVDYIDNDDYITVFQWWPGNPDANDQYVYGTELPRLVLNEAYAQLDNDKNDPGLTDPDITKWQATKYKLNVWAELHNPFFDPLPGAAYPRDASKAVLQQQPVGMAAGDAIYRVVLSTPDANLRKPSNAALTPPQALPNATVKDWGAATVVEPSNGAVGSIKSFYVLGPKADYLTDRDPQLPTSLVSSAMSVDYPKAAGNPPGALSIVLQRLACPHVPYNISDASKPYNPYITVDVLELPEVNNGIVYDYNSPPGMPKSPSLPSAFKTRGRKQPYAGDPSPSELPVQVTRPDPALNKQPLNTFFWHNAYAIDATNKTITPNPSGPGPQQMKTPFDWLVHLDRPLSSPMELLQVSGFGPNALTKEFVTVATNYAPGQHCAKWFGTIGQSGIPSDPPTRQETMLYRLFEFVQTPDLMNPGSYRVPGKINLNTVFDRETFYALLDLPPGNQALAQQMFQKFQASRGIVAGKPLGPTEDDFLRSAWAPQNGLYPMGTPFKSLATGYSPSLDVGVPFPTTPQIPNGQNIDKTILRNDGSAVLGQDYVVPRLFEMPGQAHPYKKYELLNKIYNNTTVRSNCFAMWLTVGFFEVTDMDWSTSPPTPYNPPKLGKEIGREEGRNLRHRMFAIIDRTQMVTPLNPAVLDATIVNPGLQPVNIAMVQMTSPMGIQGKIDIGSVLVVDKGSAQEETITVMAVGTAPPSITANFTKAHNKGVALTLPLTPGAYVAGPLGTATINGTVVPNVPTVYGNPGPQPRFDHRNATSIVTHYSIIE